MRKIFVPVVIYTLVNTDQVIFMKSFSVTRSYTSFCDK